MVDIKYHIASLAAVFLALGIGILMGITMVGNDAILEQQEKLTSRLESDLNLLREDDAKKEEALAQYERVINEYQQFSNDVLPALIENRLEEVEMAVIETNINPINDQIIANFVESGATVYSITSFSSPVKLTDEARTMIIEYLEVEEELSDEQLKEKISVEVASGIRAGENFEFLTLLEDLDIIRLSGEYDVPISSVVITGGSQDENSFQVDIIDNHIIRELAANEISVFGVEHSNVEFSYMENYQQHKISTIDNIDTIMGQVALIWAMEDSPGNYGVKETANAILP